MELRHLVTFKMIVEKGGFKKADEQLGYAQSSVTNHIKELEEELNQPLFDRLGKKVILTNFGKEFYPYAIKIMDLYTEIKEKANRHGEPTGDLTIGASDALTSCRLPPILLEYKERFPGVNLSIASIDYQNVQSELQQGNIDLALVLKKNDWAEKNLHSVKIKQEPLVLITPLKDKQRGNGKTVLYTDRTCASKSLFDEYLTEHHIEIDGSVDFGSVEPIKQCVMNGLGISMLAYFNVKRDLENKLFNGEIIKDDKYTISTFVTYHKDKWVSPAMNSMIHLIQSFSKDWE